MLLEFYGRYLAVKNNCDVLNPDSLSSFWVFDLARTRNDRRIVWTRRNILCVYGKTKALKRAGQYVVCQGSLQDLIGDRK
jgi:hypothetical protein